MRPKLWSLLSLAVFLAFWETIGKLFAPDIVSSPTKVFSSLLYLFFQKQFWAHLKTSGLEFAGGAGIAIPLGIFLGITIGWYERINWIAAPIFASVYSTPLYAFIPLILISLGIDIGSKIFIVAMVAVFPVVISVAGSVRSFKMKEDRELGVLAMCASFGAGGAFLLYHVILPTMAPVIFSGVRIGIARSLVGVFIAELFASSKGVGFFIMQAGSAFQIEQMYAGILIFTVSGLVLHAFVNLTEKRLCFWGWKRNG